MTTLQGFDDKMEKMICNQLIEHVTNPNIRERLLLDPDLTLDKVVTIAIQLESVVNRQN